jgi:hypothetical protein
LTPERRLVIRSLEVGFRKRGRRKRAAAHAGLPSARAQVHPRVAKDRDENFDAALSALVDTALEPLDATQQDRAVARAMVDLNTWQALPDQCTAPSPTVSPGGVGVPAVTCAGMPCGASMSVTAATESAGSRPNAPAPARLSG